MAINIHKIPIDLYSDVRGLQIYLFPQKLCFLYHLFQVEWKTHIFSLFTNCSTNSTIFCRLWLKYLTSIKRVGYEWQLPHNLVSIFQVENVLPGKTREKRYIFSTPSNRFSSSFHQHDRTVSGYLILVAGDPEKYRSM